MLTGMAGGMSRPLPVRGRLRSRAGSPGRHCWVADPADDTTGRRAGLLVEWRRAVGGGWEGRVVYVAALRPGRWALVEEWVDESLLGPV